MAADQFVIDGICHPYNFSEENLRGRFGRIFNNVLYAFHPLLTPPEVALSKDEWEHDWQNDEFMETMLLESDTDMVCVHSIPVLAESNGSAPVALVTGAARGIGRGIDAPALLMPSYLQVFENK